MLTTLIIFCIVDYLTGLVKGILHKKLSSEIAWKGGIKKCLIFVVIGLAFALDKTLLVDKPMLRNLSTGYYIVSEALSVLENIGECGIPIPRALKQILAKLNRDNKSNDPPENDRK